jgi:UDP-glucose 4-epimerase
MLTGGSGYVGSHIAGVLLQKNIDFVIVDNLSNSDKKNINVLENFFSKTIKFEVVDLRDLKNMRRIFNTYEISSIIHLASLKSVNESFLKPKLYEENNVYGSKLLIDLLKEFNVKKFIFSSSACVYGNPKKLPIKENHSLNPINPYGQNKVDIEFMIKDDLYFNKKCCTKILRYFNPIGSFTDGLIGEIFKGEPQNLIPSILSIIADQNSLLEVYGNDYKTKDGTAIRDYIHIMDLTDAHYLALLNNDIGIDIFNVGTGEGYSVLDIINTFKKVNKIDIPYIFKPRRRGDVESCYADNNKIKKILKWIPTRNLDSMCVDAFRFSRLSYK